VRLVLVYRCENARAHLVLVYTASVLYQPLLEMLENQKDFSKNHWGTSLFHCAVLGHFLDFSIFAFNFTILPPFFDTKKFPELLDAKYASFGGKNPNGAT